MRLFELGDRVSFALVDGLGVPGCVVGRSFVKPHKYDLRLDDGRSMVGVDEAFVEAIETEVQP